MKKKLLIYWVSRTFVEVFEPLIPKLAKDFGIVVMILDYSTPAGTMELLNFWKKEGLIEEYLLTPSHKNMLEVHLFMKSAIKKLKPYKFDFWLSGSHVQVIERYIQECILPKNCVCAALWHNITYLFMYNENLARDLLKEAEIGRELSSAQKQQPGGSLRGRSLAEKAGQIKTFSDLFRKVSGRVMQKFRLSRKRLQVYCERVILPLALVGKTFRFRPYDNLTQIGSGNSDAVIFTDEIEARAHKALFKTSNIYTARYPTQGGCRCNGGKEDKTAVLSPLSGFVGRDKISREALDLFFRDFRIVFSKTNVRDVHLRSHPDETGSWHIQLRDYLIKNGINARIVGCERPIREIMCNYLGMAGYASASLRDARASCDYAFVVGFAGISRFQFSNPKFVFGKSEGISWIEEDGSYDREIFVRNRYIFPERRSVPDILKKLSGNTGHI